MDDARAPWAATVEELEPGRIQRLAFLRADRPATFDEVLRAWRDDASFRADFSVALARCPFAAFRWETPPLRAETASRPFECVLVATSPLAPDPVTFVEHFEAEREADVLAFPNLGGDARLVVPAPRAPDEVYAHLASFVRRAPDDQRHALWRLVARDVLRRLGPRPLWLSTAGGGVGWLHVRLDASPKYYAYGPYRSEGRGGS